MHAGGGTNDRREKRNVLIVSVLLPIGSDVERLPVPGDPYPTLAIFVLVMSSGFYSQNGR